MEWVIKLEARSGWGDVETIEVGRLERRADGGGGRPHLGRGQGSARRTGAPDPADPNGDVRHLRPCMQGLYEAQTPSGYRR